LYSGRSEEYLVEQLLGKHPVRPVRSRCGPVQPFVDVVQLLTEVAPHVKPPVAHEHGLAELCAVRAQERRLPAVDVAIVPRLTPGVHVREESRIRLVVAIEVRVRHHGQHGIVRARFACNNGDETLINLNFLVLNCNRFPTVYLILNWQYNTVETKVGHLQVDCCTEVIVQRYKISTDILI